eukprot:2468094-Rhodomonas_salina.1
MAERECGWGCAGSLQGACGGTCSTAPTSSMTLPPPPPLSAAALVSFRSLLPRHALLASLSPSPLLVHCAHRCLPTALCTCSRRSSASLFVVDGAFVRVQPSETRERVSRWADAGGRGDGRQRWRISTRGRGA